LVLTWFVIGNSVNYIKKGNSSMNQKLKQAGLFAILAVFTMSLTTSFVGNSEAFATRADTPTEPTDSHPRAEARDAIESEAGQESPRSSSDPTRPAAGPTEAHPRAESRDAIASEDLKVEASSSLQQITVQDLNTRPGTDFVITGDETTFRVVYAILNPADIDLRNVEILVTSDTESVKGELFGDYDKRRAMISVMIDAVDPASVKAKIIG